MMVKDNAEIGERIWAAALTLVGTPFRLHGRCAAGLDCVGVVARALMDAGVVVGAVPDGYRLRGNDAAAAEVVLRNGGLRAVSGAMHRGDIVLIAPSPRQLHLAVLGQGAAGDLRSIHAHIGLGRVVEMPALPEGVLLSRWRIPGRVAASFCAPAQAGAQSDKHGR